MTSHDEEKLIKRDIPIDEQNNEIVSINLPENVKTTIEYQHRWFTWFEFDQNAIKLLIMIALVSLFFVAELVGGLVGGSLALLADAFHMLSDGISLLVGLGALWLSKRKRSAFLSYGWGRAEVLGGLVNGVFLLSVCLFIFLEAGQRFVTPEPIENPILILIVGVLGMVVNIIGMIMFCGHAHGGHGHSHGGHGHSHGGHGHAHGTSHEESEDDEHHSHSHAKKVNHKNLNLAGVFLHIFGDFLGSIGVIIAAVLSLIFSPENHPWVNYIDPLVSVIFTCIILMTSIPLVKSCSKILLQAVPEHINLERLENDIRKLKGVLDLHELHVWSLVSTKIVASLHVTCLRNEDFMKLAPQIKKICHDYGIHSTTIQPEFIEHPKDVPEDCQLICSEECIEHYCCPPTKNEEK